MSGCLSVCLSVCLSDLLLQHIVCFHNNFFYRLRDFMSLELRRFSVQLRIYERLHWFHNHVSDVCLRLQSLYIK